MLSPLIPKALKSLRKNWERNWASGAERKKETLGRERPKIESRTQQHSKNWVCLPHTLLKQILLFLHYLEYFMFGKHLSSVVGPHKCWRWYNFLLLMLWWIFNFFINAFIKFLTNVWVTSPNLVEEKSGWAVWGVWRLEQLGGKAHVVDKIQEFWASIAEGAVQQFQCSLFAALSALQPWVFLSGISWDPRHLEATVLGAHRTSGGSSFLSPGERDNDPEPSIWAFPVATTLCSVLCSLRAFFPSFLNSFSVWITDFMFQELYHSPDLLNFGVDHLIPPAPQLLPLWAGKWLIDSSKGSNKAQLHFNTISLSCRSRICLTGGELFLFHAPSSGAPWEIAKFQQRFPQNQAGLKLSLAPF